MGSETCETFFDDDVVDDTGSDGDGRRDWPFEPVPLYDEVEVPPSSERDRGGNSDPGDRGEGRRGVVIIDLSGDDEDDDNKPGKPVVIDISRGDIQF